jgi:hypothetical protein
VDLTKALKLQYLLRFVIFVFPDSGAKLDLMKAPKARATGRALIALESE